jgi:hypothetical protein
MSASRVAGSVPRSGQGGAGHLSERTARSVGDGAAPTRTWPATEPADV